MTNNDNAANPLSKSLSAHAENVAQQSRDWLALQRLLVALGASAVTLRRRDECGDPRILGRAGHIYADGDGFLLYVQTRSPRAWGFAKKRLAFCRVSQDGDDEGCLALNHLPDAAEAAEIRAVLRIRKRLDLSPEILAASRARMLAIRGVQALGSRKTQTPGPGRPEGGADPFAGPAAVAFMEADLPASPTGPAG